MDRKEFLAELETLAQKASNSPNREVVRAAAVLYGHISALTVGGEILDFYNRGTKELVERNNAELDKMIGV